MLTLVAGGAGFLGSHLVDALLAEGGSVVIADNMSTGSLQNIDAALRGGRTTFAFVDVARPLSETRAALTRAARGKTFDQIFHLASPSRSKTETDLPWAALMANAIGTMALIDLALEQRARLVYVSSSEVYGNLPPHPIPETFIGSVDPLGPRANYSEGKRFSETLLSVAVEHRGLDARIVRLFDCYGPRMGDAYRNIVSELAQAALAKGSFPVTADGSTRHSLIFVDDAIRLLLLVARSPMVALEPVNAGGEQLTTAIEIAESLARAAGIPCVTRSVPASGETRFGGIPDLTRARALGFVPRTSLDSGLRTTLQYLGECAEVYV